jgi:mandelate racemase
MAMPRLTVHSLRARAVDVALARPLTTSSGTIPSAPLVLIDLLTNEGITGRSYIFTYTSIALKPTAQLIAHLGSAIEGEDVAPLVIEQKLQQLFRLLGPQGLVGMALSAIDMAAWDALAQANDLPLVKFLGGEARPIPAYASLGMGSAQSLAREAEEMVEQGFRAIKFKVGFPEVRTDLEVIRAVRSAVGKEIALMVDYNQYLSVSEALQRLRLLDKEELAWIEEPTRADDYAGHAQISCEARTPIQLGENWWGLHDMTKSVTARASDLVMPDVMKIGGVTGWQRAAALAASAGLLLSSHTFPEFSAHLLAVSPTAHWLEYLDLARTVLKEPVVVNKGYVIPSSRPGAGLIWREEMVQRYLLS